MPADMTERMQLVLSPEDKVAIDEWRRAQPDLPSRSEAVRRLIRLGMKAARPGA
jgi:hypothetical protein